mmetsp:Transcript_56904/g.123682  ORF Transcript_56904/g.123682 Transcript_56904/m.123682 type:complete len:223 (+) Transcript_56904:226-894(+)
MCQPDPNLLPEQNAVRTAGVIVLILGIIGVFGVLVGNILGLLSGILCIVAGSLVVCCAPLNQTQGHDQYHAAGYCGLVAMGIDIGSMIWVFVLMILFFSEEEFGYAVYTIWLLALYAVIVVFLYSFAQKAFKAKAAVRNASRQTLGASASVPVAVATATPTVIAVATPVCVAIPANEQDLSAQAVPASTNDDGSAQPVTAYGHPVDDPSGNVVTAHAVVVDR